MLINGVDDLLPKEKTEVSHTHVVQEYARPHEQYLCVLHADTLISILHPVVLQTVINMLEGAYHLFPTLFKINVIY